MVNTIKSGILYQSDKVKYKYYIRVINYNGVNALKTKFAEHEFREHRRLPTADYKSLLSLILERSHIYQILLQI